MAPLQHLSLKKVLFLILLLVFFTSIFSSAHQTKSFGRRRSMLEVEEEDETVIKKKTTSTKLSSSKNTTKVIKSNASSSKNQTNLIKSNIGSIKNQTKLIKLPSDSAKNKTKPMKSTSDSIKDSTTTIKSQLKKLNSTSKTSNSTTTKTSSISPKKSSDSTKLNASKNKTTKPITSKETKTKIQLEKILSESESKSKNPEKTPPKKAQKQSQPSWIDQDDDEDDLVSGFKDLPSKFQETLLPDLERISKTSKVYLTKYNKEFTKGFKPYVGNKYAPMIASIASFAFILIPLVLVSLIFNRIKAYFSLQKVLIFIQAYLTIYFSILCLSSLVTGLEPVKFFYATSQSTYVCVQVLQTLAYVLYLLLLLMYLILVFSTETGLATKILGLGQTFVGFAIGLHCYMTVFHRAVLHQPPKTSWKIHALYATCFLVICLLGRVDRRKKAYVEDDGEEGKKS